MSGALFVMIALTAAACDEVSIDVDFDGVRGSGNVITETRDVSGFDEIVVLGSGIVEVSVTGIDSVTIEAEDNIIPLLTTDVSDGRLELGTRESFSTTRQIVYTITVVDLRGLEINGSGDVTAGRLDSESFDVTINGSGDVDATGTAGRLTITVNGSGGFDGRDLVVDDASVRVAGSGSAIVNVIQTLDVEIGGSGNVDYIGDPTVTQSITGSGEVVRR